MCERKREAAWVSEREREMGGAVKVYGVGASPFVATVLLCLEETGADYELVPLDMAAREQRTEPHLSRNVRRFC